MGSCMSNQRQKSIQDWFKRDNILIDKKQVYQPLFTTLFNVMRKSSDSVLLFTDQIKAKKYNFSSFNQIKLLPAKSLKMLYSFKKLIIIGNFQKINNDIIQISKSAPVSATYVLSQKMFQKYQKQFPLFFNNQSQNKQQIQLLKIPLLIFNSQQLLNPPPKQLLIFIHLIDQRQNQIYSKLNLQNSNIIDPSNQQFVNKDKQCEYYLQKLKRIQSKHILILHKKGLGQNNLMDILSKFIVYLYEINQLSVRQYLARSLPNANVIGQQGPLSLIDTQNNISQVSTIPLKVQKSNQQRKSLIITSPLYLPKTSQPQNATTIFESLFKSHYNQNNKQKTERGYNLLSKLISNIIANPSISQQNNYRKVKSANKQMQQLLTRNKSGIKLLNQLGFVQKDGYWINSLQLKYLKVLRTDMDLGHKNYIVQQQSQN